MTVPIDILVCGDEHTTTLNWNHIVNMRVLDGGRTQITMHDGHVYLTTEKKFEIKNRILRVLGDRRIEGHVNVDVRENR